MTQPGFTINNNEHEVDAIARIVAGHMTVQQVALRRGNSGDAPVLAVPKDLKLESVKALLDEYLERPERKSGTSQHLTLDSFVQHVNRFKNPEGMEQSVLFAWLGDEDSDPALTCIYDYHEPGKGRAGWGEYQAYYSFPVSDEWAAWSGVAEEAMSQADFAEFLEDHIVDVSAPEEAGENVRLIAQALGSELASPAQLMALARGLTVNVGRRVTNAHVLSSGESQIAFQEDHTDETGHPLRVPSVFQIAIPVFEDGGPWQLPIRLRYRVQGGTITWRIQPHRMDETLRGVMKIACDQAAQQTELPLYWGNDG